MDFIFPFAASGEYHTPSSELPSLLNQQVNSHLTGVIQISWLPEFQISILFIQGDAVNAYLVTTDGNRKILPSEWPAFVGKNETEVRILYLPVEGIRVTKMLFECLQKQGVFQLQTADLVRRFDGWSISPETIVVQIHWQHAEAVMVFPGNAMAVQPVIFSKEGQIVTEKDALTAITSWKEPTCTVSIFSDCLEKDAWKEYRLHLTFTNTAELVLTRYNELAGRSLISVLNQDIDDETLRRGWRISCVGNGILDHHIFSSPEDAARAYRKLFSLIFAHMETVIGRKISDSIVREVMEAVVKTDREILQNYRMLFPTPALVPETGGEDE